MIPDLKFSAGDVETAQREWGANCGPVAIAAITGRTLEEMRRNLLDFRKKRYTTPTLMWAILDGLGVVWRRRREPLEWPDWGLVRIQWHGPWTAPGVPPQAAYPHTHWIGAAKENGEVHVFDVNAVRDSAHGWLSLERWSRFVVPWILENCVAKADGRWSLTHSVEIARTGTFGGNGESGL